MTTFVGGGGAQASDGVGGNVASGDWGVVVGGFWNTASGTCVVMLASFVCGARGGGSVGGRTCLLCVVVGGVLIVIGNTRY